MLTYNQRYRPRTEREYTKTDLTVYDSAGNTALRGLKVYGKSEIVDGAIKSAGEGYAVVDLGTLTWTLGGSLWYTTDLQAEIKPVSSNDEIANIICAEYKNSSRTEILGYNMRICVTTTGAIGITNNNYTDPTQFKTAMSGVLLCYQLADPSQGNCIAVKTDNGTGIGGTMATFSTGTPLYGINADIRDVMEWSGLSGEVTKNCASTDLVNFDWRYETATATPRFYTNDSLTDAMGGDNSAICSQYNYSNSPVIGTGVDSTIYIYKANKRIYVNDSRYTTVSDFTTGLAGAKLIYELATPVVELLAQTENDSIASLRAFDGTTHFTNNATTDMTINYTIKVPTIS